MVFNHDGKCKVLENRIRNLDCKMAGSQTRFLQFHRKKKKRAKVTGQVQEAKVKFYAKLADERLYMKHGVDEKGEKVKRFRFMDGMVGR